MRASHKESGRMGHAGRKHVQRPSTGQIVAEAQLRHERLSGRTSENTGREWRLCTFQELFSHIFIQQIHTEHMAHARNCARYCQFSRNKAGVIPAVSKLSFWSSKFCREEFLVASKHSFNFVACCQAAHFGVYSALPGPTCSLGQQTPQSCFLTESGCLARHSCLLSQ